MHRDRLRKLRRDTDEVILDGATYAARLRDQFTRVHGTAEWANHVQEDDKDGVLLRRAGPVLARSSELKSRCIVVDRSRH